MDGFPKAVLMRLEQRAFEVDQNQFTVKETFMHSAPCRGAGGGVWACPGRCRGVLGQPPPPQRIKLPGASVVAVSEGRAYAPFRPTGPAGVPKTTYPSGCTPVSDMYHTIFFNHTHALVHIAYLGTPPPPHPGAEDRATPLFCYPSLLNQV